MKYTLYRDRNDISLPYIVIQGEGDVTSGWFSLEDYSFIKYASMNKYGVINQIYGTFITDFEVEKVATFKSKKTLLDYIDKLKLLEELRQ